MPYPMQKTLRGKPHNIDCTESSYHEVVKVKSGKCECERMSTMLHLRSRGYVEIKKAAPEKKKDVAKPAKKTASKKK